MKEVALGRAHDHGRERVRGSTAAERLIVLIFLLVNIDVLFYLCFEILIDARNAGRFGIEVFSVLPLYFLFVLGLGYYSWSMYRLPKD
jgi:hypothetical protein